MSDGKVIEKECQLYECYNIRIENSRYCIFHQRVKAGE